MQKSVRWGILSTAKIARTWLIPALQSSASSEIVAVASRSQQEANKCAMHFGIPNAYGSYEALINNKDIDAIYIPLPNNLHSKWTIAAIESGKHVLCEKPLGLNLSDVKKIVDAAKMKPSLKVMEAFMYRFHPQWKKAREIIDFGLLGTVNSVYSVFSYFNRDEHNVRNQPGVGGGALMDVGCYCISVARLLFNDEPLEVMADMDIDPQFKVDRLTLGSMKFPAGGRAQFRCATQSEASQQVVITGDRGELTIETPYYQQPGVRVNLYLKIGGDVKTLKVESCNHYHAQIEAFNRAILDDTPVPICLSDAIANIRVIDAMCESAKTGRWKNLNTPLEHL